jgi:hypothetical protein
MSEKKQKAHLWQPGVSGNPKGRRPGSGEVARLRQAIAEHTPSIIERLVASALAGDTSAARLLLERVAAPLKAEEAPQPFDLAPGTLTARGTAILEAVAAGALPASTGASLLGAVGTLARVAEVDELTRRIEALEAGRGQEGGKA